VVFVMLTGQLFAPGITLGSISENYLWRKNLAKIYSNVKYRIGDRVFANTVVGKNDWLFFTGDMSIRDHQKTSPLNMGNMKRLTRSLNEIKDQTEQYGGMFLLIIAPDKSTVYPQYMPDEIPVLGQTSSFDRLVEYLDRNSDIQLLDVRPVFSKASETAELYYKTDTHWNCMGAFYASNEILSKVSIPYPQVPLYTLDDYKFSARDALRDIPVMMGWDIHEDTINALPKFKTEISSVTEEADSPNRISLKIAVNAEKDLPELLIFHDSFYEVCLDRFLEPNFSRTTSTYYRKGELVDYLDVIAAEKPDVVIVEFAERYMDYLYRHLSK
jgi:alginate O-acetyltransferase complex protein AlgJ